MITDLKYAFRVLIQAPAFTIIAVLTLALGIGANSAIFSVVDAVLLRPLPFHQPNQLVMVWGSSAREPQARHTASFPDFYDFRDHSQSFDAMAAYIGIGTVLTGVGAPQELHGAAVTGDILAVLGLKPIFGRGFTPEEMKPGGSNTVLIGHGLWERSFASDPKIIGQQVVMAGRPLTVIGILPPLWAFPVAEGAKDFLMAVEPLNANDVTQRGSHFLRVIGRLKPGVTVREADTEMKAIAARLQQQYPGTNRDRSVTLVPLLDDVVGDVRQALLILMGAVALVLLIACSNVANLLLARGATRSREMGIRIALGASRLRIVRQLFAESVLLGLLGGTGGLFLAWWSVDLLTAFAPGDVPRLEDLRIDPGVCAFTFGLAVFSTLLFGLVPAVQASRGNVHESLQQSSKSSSGGMHSTRLRAALVVSQVSLSLLLLVSAGLLIRSFLNLSSTDLGFNSSRLLVLDHILPRATYPDADGQRRFYERLLPRIASLPGVESVAGGTPLPFSNNDNTSSFAIAGQPPHAPGQNPNASLLSVVPGYFKTMETPLRRGRDFGHHDSENTAPVAIVNDIFASRFFPHVDPIGQRVLLPRRDSSTPDASEVIGVVGDSKHDALEQEPKPEIYRPFAQAPNRRLWITIRVTEANLRGLDAAVRRFVREQDPDVYVYTLEPMRAFIGRYLAQPRFNMMLLVVFAGLAMILAAIGIYGVIAYSVTQRTREIGIRMALGAQRTEMLRMILRQSLNLVAIGLAIGLIASLAGTRMMSSLLYGVGTTDVSTYALVMTLLGGAALLASYIPARRAMRVDPMVALRYE